MADWDTLFAQGRCIARFPQQEVLRFVALLESVFSERPLRVWDLCCGAGRHTLALASRGVDTFASDSAPNGIARTQASLSENGLSATLEIADMTTCPWTGMRFHGVVSWDALHHNRSAEIGRAVAMVRESLGPRGLFLATLKSTKAESFGLGRRVEPKTFIRDEGCEAGVPHHFFDESEVRALFAGWELLILVEQLEDYRERGEEFFEINPFAYTFWGILARKPA